MLKGRFFFFLQIAPEGRLEFRFGTQIRILGSFLFHFFLKLWLYPCDTISHNSKTIVRVTGSHQSISA